jgi:protein TonB
MDKEMKYFLLFLLMVPVCIKAQNKQAGDSVIKDGKTFVYVDEMPVAGYDYNQYLGENIHYPDSAIVHNIEGRVIIKFVVNEDGHISDCEVVKGFNRYCDAEALRVIRSMPPWKPGKIKGKPVKVYFTLPLSFKLD